MSRVISEDSFYVADSDEEASCLFKNSMYSTPMRKGMETDVHVIQESDSEDSYQQKSSASENRFVSAESNEQENDSRSINSEEEDMEFMNASHRVSFQVSSEFESDGSSSENKFKKKSNLKRRSIYENPVISSTSKNKCTPMNAQLKKKVGKVIRIINSDSEDTPVQPLLLSKNQGSIIINDDHSSDDEIVKNLNKHKELYNENTELVDNKIDEQNSIQNHIDYKADEWQFVDDSSQSDKENNHKSNIIDQNSNRNFLDNKEILSEYNLSLNFNSSVRKKSLNFQNLTRKSSINKKETTQQHNFIDLLDESSDSSVPNVRSRTSSISSNASLRKTSSKDDKIIDLTINKHHFPVKNEKSDIDEILVSSSTTSESEMDQDAVNYAKKEIGVGNIDPIEAQKKEFLILKVDDLQKKLDKLNKFTKTVDIDMLPDKGKKVYENIKTIKEELELLKLKLEKMQQKSVSSRTQLTSKIKKEPTVLPSVKYSLLTNDENDIDMKYSSQKSSKSEYSDYFNDFNIDNIPKVPIAGFDTRDLGKKAMDTLNKQQLVTNHRLEELHGSLRTGPSDDQMEEDPKGLKIPLMNHQKHALVWMKWRESKDKPKGGILADDMGLGKTLTMISLILATINCDKQDDSTSSNQESSDDEWYSRDSRNSRKRLYGGTLVVCPASLINQWEGEVKKHVKKGILSVLVFHGNNRQINDRKLSKYNIVITTYQTLVREAEKETGFYNMKWNRAIIDEAHVIRNHKSKASIAVCGIHAKRKWALTGTPIQNKEGDLYAILKFLNCEPFHDLQVWKRWVDNKNDAGKQRLFTIMKTIMLRRTKLELQNKGVLDALPEKFSETIEIEMDREEQLVYQKILLFSQNLFAQFLTQRAEKHHMRELYGGKFDKKSSLGSKTQFTKAQQLLLRHHSSVFKEQIESHEILVLLLRLRQMCCHPGLIHKMLEKVDAELNGIEDHENDMTEEILHQLQNVSMKEDESVDEYAADYKFDTKVATRLLTKSNPVFDDNRRSSKVRAVIKTIKNILKTGDKIIVVSQWTEVLKIVARNLVDIEDATYEMFTGEVAVKDRQAIINEFNDPRSGINILFLSLTAGGVGLNLVGANHLLLIDLHWNPQLESQAQDRIYRFGQKKNVYIYKYLCKETIEERIKVLQQKKLDCAECVLTGTRAVSTKLTLDDLKLLFS